MRQSKRRTAVLLSLLIGLVVANPIRGNPGSGDGQSGPVPLYDNLGDHHYPISSSVPDVQAYFDQGLRLYYAFNHAEAIRSFREAQSLDPECAICWWGEALAFGPNINLPMDADSARSAYAAIQKGLTLRDHASPNERALIDALAVRYEADPPQDRAHLDRAYSDSMKALTARFPDDDDIRVLFGESIMDLTPWDYWTEDGDPRAGIAEALDAFEQVMAENERHPGACHFYIHAVEKLYPERAVRCAERLADLMPGAGHVVHMPGHIYIRVGRYLDAIEANRHAVHSDETYIRDQRPGPGMYTVGYYPHNYDFLAFAASMIGRSGEAIDAADKVASLIPAELFNEPGMSFLQHWSTRSLQMRIRFARWGEILATPAPPSDRLHAGAMWHYARGRALLATGDDPGSREQLRLLEQILADPALDGMRMEYNASTDLLRIATHVLAGSIESDAGNHDAAIAELTEAVRLEGNLLYGEPPEWSVPTRHDLGTALLNAGRPAEAQDVIEDGLEQFPDNGWSLYLLSVALRQQDRNGEADEVTGRFQQIWETADVDITSIAYR
jgi:tetratricopeptide (TPR) repeat protein